MRQRVANARPMTSAVALAQRQAQRYARLEKLKTRMSPRSSGDAGREPCFSDFPVFKSVFSIDGGAIGVGV